ncbi:MAG TPA: S1 RNA-binding domain-containing protein [Leptolyngbyaceae cyanobacterium M33_DOE_097]|uniref:S1 RNA-binding domain-containing protein n=1 Tax=Oscillatoriales cyanobacterium SpSt-418 TaxID=2282169 RepID=A0A7C3KH90_9CYAN|nr:S1 RNA-binding domain-containing protein [Leptolyngbyaceae cyanobacterium M33_DOE_097]
MAISSNSSASFSMEDFENALAQYDYEFQRGQIITGKPINYDTSGVYIDIGAKAAAFLPSEEASIRKVADLSEIVPLNEEREFLIIREQNADGQITLSLRQLAFRKAWDELSEVQAEERSLQVRVTGVNKGGVTVDAHGLRGFIPRSHLTERNNLEGLVGQSLSVTVLELNREKKKLVLSNRLATRSESVSQFELGQLVEGTVSGIKPFGVFVELDGNATGLLHINQISKNYVESLEKVFHIGQSVKALVADIDSSKGRIALSIKVLERYPGENLEQLDQVMAEAGDRYEKAKKNLTRD